MNDAKNTFLVKIIPPSGYSVYRLAFTRRHLVLLGAALLLALLAAAGFHTYQLHVAEGNVRALQSLTAEQQTKLQTIDKQADDLANQLKAVQKENAEIKRLIGVDRGPKNQHAFVAPAGAPRHPDFAALQARLRSLARASAATQDDANRLQRVAMRVLNLRRLASIARERMIASIPSLNPVNGAIAAGFGWRTDPWPEFHKGVDLAADYGDTVRASAAGTVASADWDGGFGLKVDIDHGNGYHTWYAHLSRVAVSAGARVTKGEPIAFVGSTGESTGPHLHYQVMYEGNPIDPEPFLNGVPAKVLATLPDPSGV
ncbi:MAG: M23 family metallopeptidase [Candidatus Eremiobacteraeota bacterium]|nr:M23 family metallopeptidase [Candidatus Eremiobacteraeota bacterium]MBV9408419.1 M23 family metallopeptidase [Candidatus Eremiobacteraeota bacterium]